MRKCFYVSENLARKLPMIEAFAIPAITPSNKAMQSHWSAEVRAGLHAKWKIPIDRSWTIFGFFTMLFFSPAIGMLLPLKILSLVFQSM